MLSNLDEALGRHAKLFALGAGTGAVVCYLIAKSKRRPVAIKQEALPFEVRQGPRLPSGQGADVASLNIDRLPTEEMERRSSSFAQLLRQRRTVRFFDPAAPSLSVVENCCIAGATAPSGAHQQPWAFVIVQDAKVKQELRAVVEAEEQVNYDTRMKKDWLQDIASMTGSTGDQRLYKPDGRVQKPYLSEAPFLVVMMSQKYGFDADGKRFEHRYVKESCGIAAGMFVAAVHNAGLCTLTSTPLGAESKIVTILGRPVNETVFLLMPIGWPAKDATVPYRSPEELRKPKEKVIEVV
jgi:iodotyrosine deiodinase